MTGWLLRRIAQAALVVLLMTAIVFVGLHAIGNPIDILIGEDLNQQERLQAIAPSGSTSRCGASTWRSSTVRCTGSSARASSTRKTRSA